MSYGHPPRFLAPFASLYRQIVYRYPAVAPIWRSFAHRELEPPFRRTFATHELHNAIKREFGHRSGGKFFEAGANDGLLFSNTAYLERYLGWTGILVEALPHKFIECVRNRRKANVEHCALVAPDYGESSVEFRYCNLMSFAPALSKIDEANQLNLARSSLSKEERMLGDQVFLAPARTISAVLRKHFLRHIDLMVLDMEGAELQALRGIDFKEVQIDNILVEVRELEEVDRFLASHGYRRHARLSDLDYLYKLN